MAEQLSGRKFDGEKSRMELLPTAPLVAIADVLTFGAKKYDAHNWRGGFDWSRLVGAAYRHLSAFNDGEDIDPESGLPHLAHLGCCTLFLLEHQLKGIGNDDRYKPDLLTPQEEAEIVEMINGSFYLQPGEVIDDE